MLFRNTKRNKMDIILAVFKTFIVVVIVGAAVISSFYFAYIIVILCVLGGVGTIAYLFFSRDKRDTDWFDFSD